MISIKLVGPASKDVPVSIATPQVPVFSIKSSQTFIEVSPILIPYIVISQYALLVTGKKEKFDAIYFSFTLPKVI